MTKGRIEAFSDGVLAIIITIMVLELKIPRGSDVSALRPVLPLLLSYLLSFAYVGIYWNNHHHLFHATQQISGGIMWANLCLLFCLSLVPVVTGWVGEHPKASWPTALYGIVLLLAALSWLVLERAIISRNGPDSALPRAIGRKVKEKISGFLYAVAIGLAFVRTWAAQAIYVIVALMWIIPDRRIEAKTSAE
jgi:uncharacterized membrane protein